MTEPISPGLGLGGADFFATRAGDGLRVQLTAGHQQETLLHNCVLGIECQ